MDTIFALASAAGRAGVAVIRISGPAAHDALMRLAGDVPASRALRILRDPAGQVIDQALVLVFHGDKSFTGEPVVELHLHGSPAVVTAILNVLGQYPDLRPADAGEFTRRALENGKLDLTQVEGLADLIDAETEGQRKQAMRVFKGALGDLAERWRAKLIRASALIEATIDFADEEVPVDVSPEVRSLVRVVRNEMAREVAGVQAAERLRDGFEVAIVGAPNVGKSTLLNRIAGREAAITSEIAGTTRDVIEVRMDLDGIPVTLLDTAGLRDSDDTIEQMGVALARRRAEQADIRVYLQLSGQGQEITLSQGDLVVEAKSDIGTSKMGLSVSGKTGAGVDALINAVSVELKTRVSGIGIAMRDRHRLAMMRAMTYLDIVNDELESESSTPDLIAEELRSAVRAVDMIVGRVDVEQVLDEIFSSFCIGK